MKWESLATLGSRSIGRTTLPWQQVRCVPGKGDCTTNYCDKVFDRRCQNLHAVHFGARYFSKGESASIGPDGETTPWIALGCGYRQEFGSQVWSFTWDYDRMSSWQLGAELNNDWFAQYPARFAAWNASKRVLMSVQRNFLFCRFHSVMNGDHQGCLCFVFLTSIVVYLVAGIHQFLTVGPQSSRHLRVQAQRWCNTLWRMLWALRGWSSCPTQLKIVRQARSKFEGGFNQATTRNVG